MRAAGAIEGTAESHNYRLGPEQAWNSALLEDGVFKRFRGAQTNNGLRLDLDLFAGLGIAAQTSFAVSLYHAADVRDYKFSGGALCFLHCEFEKFFKEEHCVLF